MRENIKRFTISDKDTFDFKEKGTLPDQNTLQRISSNDPTLTSLDLMHNNIGYQGAQSIANALNTNSSITTLDFQSNDIGDEGAESIVDALNTNSSITSLDLRYNMIEDNYLSQINTLLEKNKGLHEQRE